MDDTREHAFEHRIRFDECDAGGLLRAGGYLRLMQDLAWRHSEVLGLDRAWYRANHLGWLVRYADLRISGEAHPGETMRLTTRVTGQRRVWARRASSVTIGGIGVAGATIDWVLVDANGRPARIPPEVAARFTDGIPTFQPARLASVEAPDDAVSHPWEVGIRDLDPMGHVNNGTYLDMLDEALAAGTDALAGPRPPVRYEVEYLRPALPGQTVSVTHWCLDDVTWVRCTDTHGQELVRARVHLG